jgi:hypothetical protein
MESPHALDVPNGARLSFTAAKHDKNLANSLSFYTRTRLQVQMKCPLLSNPRVALTTFSGNAPGSPVCENARGAPHRDRMPGFRDAIGRRWTSMRQIRSLRRLDQGLDLI